MPNTTQAPKTLTTRQVAALLDKSVSQITRYADQLDPRPEKLPGRTGHWLFTMAQVDEIRTLIDQRKAGGDKS